MTRKIHPARPPNSAALHEDGTALQEDHAALQEAPTGPARLHPLVIAAAVSVLATALSHGLPENFAASGVALVFLASTYALCLRVGHPLPPAHYGLSLGGLMEPEPLGPLRVLRELAQALSVATLVALLIFPPFWWGFVTWYAPSSPFDLARAFTFDGASSPAKWLLEMSLWHVLGVALPEEAFFRGYLQTSLREKWTAEWRLGPLPLSWAIVATSAVFALGHLATDPHPARLAVFFPSLLFGAVRGATGGIGAAVFLHAECNLFSQWLAQGYGL